MTTEQYSIGYEEGYQDGWNAAMDAKPASKPLTWERVREICKGSGYDKATMQERADFINGIRHAEAAHGIKGDA